MTLAKDETSLVRCIGQIQGYQAHIHTETAESTFARWLMEHCHPQSLYGGVAVTEKFFIPKPRSVVKTVVHKCNLC